MSDLTVQAQNTDAQKKQNYAKKGAIIATGVSAVSTAAHFGLSLKALGKDEFVKAMKTGIEDMGGKGKYAALVAAGLAFNALIGAGIGKLVEKFKAKKQDSENLQEITNNKTIENIEADKKAEE